MKFKKNNKIMYGQDHHFFQGIPDGIEFEAVIIGSLIELTGDGFGLTGNYGNGSIYIHLPTSETLVRDVRDSLGEVAFQAIVDDVKTKILESIDEIKR